MTGGIVPIRILILNSNSETRLYFADTLRSCLRLIHLKLDEFDGNNLDHETTLALLKKNYDYIFLNLRLPCALSVRIAELAHLAKLQTRLVLTSGTMLREELLTPLFDVFIRLPCLHGEVESAIWAASALAGQARTSLPTEEHVEAAIKSLVTDKDADYLWGLALSDGFDHYRAYFPPLPPLEQQKLAACATLGKRLSVFGLPTLADYSPRLARAVLAISESRFLNMTFKLFLMDQLLRVSDQMQVHLQQKPRQMAELLDCVDGVANLLTGRRKDLDRRQITDALRRIQGFETLGGLIEHALIMLPAERSG